MYPEFAKETKNLRFALGTDGMNPFGKKRSVLAVFMKRLLADLSRLSSIIAQMEFAC
jgi:hypothetical protein